MVFAGQSKQKIKRIEAIFLLIVTAFLWSFGGVLIKQISWNSMAIAGMRSAIAIPFILLVLRRSHLRWSVNQIGGAISYAGTVTLFVIATKLTSAANAIVLQYTAPIYVALFSGCFLKERVTWSDWIAIITAIFGIALFFFDKLTIGNYWGNIFAIFSGMSFGFLILFMRKQKSGFPLGSIFLGNVLTVMICLPFMFDSMPDGPSWVCLIALGALQLGLPYILYSVAIKRVTALEGIMIPFIEPVFNPVWVFLFLGEIPGRWAVLGGIIVISSVVSHFLIRGSSEKNV